MDFNCFMDLVNQCQYDEIKVIGKDLMLQGKRIHLIAMMRKGEQAELCMLMHKEKERKKKKKQVGAGRESNRELMKDYVTQGFMNMQTLCIGDFTFESRESEGGELSTNRMDSMLLLAKLAGEGWQLPIDHPLLKENWERIEMIHYRFACPYEQLPDWDGSKLKICWHANMKRYLIEKQIHLIIGDGKEQKDAQIAFSIRDENGTVRDGICYLNKVRLEDPWEEIDKRYEDPEYQKRMLEFMTPEEFAQMRQSSNETMEQVCPRGMYLLVIEYECTLALELRFYTWKYLNSEPECSGKAVSMMSVSTKGPEIGLHGLPLKSAFIQSPMTADVKKVQAELFEAYEMIPACEEELTCI